MSVEIWLPVAWFGVVGFAVLMYVLMDGFVLGIGIISPLADDEAQRDTMMNTAAPIWDGNETWLVLGGTGLFAAFPKAYAVVLSGLYLPILMLLIALVFRGVAFEFRFKAVRTKIMWGRAFFAGSLLAAFAQGLILGCLVQGMPLKDNVYTGGAFAWLSPFPLMTGVAVVCGYALLGTGWLVLKTEARLQRIALNLLRPLIALTIAFMLMVSLWLPYLASGVMQRWVAWPGFLWLSPIPLLTAWTAVALWRSASSGNDLRPFVLSLCMFGLGFFGLAVGLWPNIVPPDLSIWNAASPPSSQGFILVGMVLLLPVILGYTYWSYSVFRGKIAADGGYHH